jgi:hypothetical protein
MSNSPRVSIIVLNWNGCRDTIECLESLFGIRYPSYDVIVVDNGSEDDSVRNIELYADGRMEVKSRFFEYSSDTKPIAVVEYLKDGVDFIEAETTKIDGLVSNRRLSVVRNQMNLGFAEGNNVGIRLALKAFCPDYVLLLNNDAVVASDFLAQLIDVAEVAPEAGIFSPKILFYDQPERIQGTWNRVKFSRGKVYMAGTGELDRGQYDVVAETDYSQGVCFLIRRTTIERVGFFDPEFFCYSEESDYCFRARKAGIKSLYVPKARVWHKLSQTANRIDGFVLYYTTRNRFRFTRRHASTRQYFIFTFQFFTIQIWMSLLSLLAKRTSARALRSYLRGAIEGLELRPG